jgi:hypothetical protein
MREKASTMENTVNQIVAGEREATEKRIRLELGNDLKQLNELKRDNENLRVGLCNS